MSTDIVLEVQHLKKHFGSSKVVDDVSLTVRRGEIFGFLGSNGAGKTTTISMILGLIYPTSGEVKIFDETVTPQRNAVLKRVGTMVGSPPALMQPFSARENVQCMAYMRPDLPAKRVDEVLARVGLRDVAHRKARKFSTGMKQRLGLAVALVNQPDLLILDEPTNGMDPAGMQEVRLLLRSLAQQGTAIFLSSHLLHEMELLCDRVAVIQKGRIITQGNVSDLLSTQEVVRINTTETERVLYALSFTYATIVKSTSTFIDLQGLPSDKVITYLTKQGIIPQQVSVIKPDLESVFLNLTRQDATTV